MAELAHFSALKRDFFEGCLCDEYPANMQNFIIDDISKVTPLVIGRPSLLINISLDGCVDLLRRAGASRHTTVYAAFKETSKESYRIFRYHHHYDLRPLH